MSNSSSEKNQTSQWTEGRGITSFLTSMTTYCPLQRHLAYCWSKDGSSSWRNVINKTDKHCNLINLYNLLVHRLLYLLYSADKILHNVHCSQQLTESTQKTIENVPPNLCPYLCQMLTDFKNSFTGTLCGKFAIKRLLNIPPHLKYVANLLHYTVKHKWHRNQK